MLVQVNGWPNPYGFNAPTHAGDLRLVMSQHSADTHETHQVAYRSRFGETRVIKWLTWKDAHSRAQLLRKRGYSVNVSTMGI